jgi:flavin-binding protein dodecin
MADPILPDIHKCQVVFFGVSGLPEDVFINNWYFRNDGIAESPNGAISRVLNDFYTLATPNAVIVGAQMSTIVKDAFEFRFYDLGQAPPRTRNTIQARNLPGRASTPYPAEVALVSSFYAGSNVPRRRGRHYLGPLSAGTSGGGVDPRPASNILVAIKDAAVRVASTTENVSWVQVSQMDQMASVVTGGWVDNAYDTQRRRGTKASTRTSW